MCAPKESPFADWPDASVENQASAVALVELVEGPTPGQTDLISEPAIWVHTACYTYRSGMDDNDPRLPHLAFIEHQFIAALGAMNFGDQMPQLHQALRAIRTFRRGVGDGGGPAADTVNSAADMRHHETGPLPGQP